ncbi:PRC and DUF2382 domain-containing protein [Saccharothrix yanglingensis]|uniref:Uncharacterized protein n=1 Tax=Saccharothrix yanglingensis TaxID=659496 RepID=A0ABU0XBR6_9PSEU|nr:PRC and DUF2382 domain-containing protein [Saccharothrix yanglingensis]MDQ2588124.1 hypothetical protein [Saccharothrix yanglingensis]
MINQAEVDRLYDCEVIDEHGERIGSVKQIWLDDRDGRPMWASVHTGLFGLRESFVPIQDATMGNGTITVHVDKQQVKDAPRVDVSDQHMSDEQQDELYAHYGMIPAHRSGDHDRLPGGKARSGGQAAGGMAAGPAAGGGVADRTPGSADERGVASRQGRHETRADDAVTRYEEDVHVGTREAEAGRVRLVKHTVTEQRDMTVPVTHEEVRVVREPADGAPTDRAFTDEEASVTLRREEPVVEKTTKPVERVRLEKEAVTEQERVSGQVRKERVDVERDDRRDS